MTTVEEVHDALRRVVDPCSAATGVPLSILDMGLLRSVEIAGGVVSIELRLTSPLCHQSPYFLIEVERRVAELPGVRSVTCRTDMGLDWDPAMMSPGAVRRLAEQRDRT